LIYLTTSGSNCLQTAQNQLTVIQVPRHGEFTLLGQYYCMSQVESRMCTARSGSTSRNKPIIWCLVPTLSSCDMYMTLGHTEYFDYCNQGWSVGYTIINYRKPHQNITWKVICGSVILHGGPHPPSIFAASYCKGSFVTGKYTHPTCLVPRLISSYHTRERAGVRGYTQQAKQQLAACRKSVIYVWAYYTLYCMCVITSRCTRAAASEADTIRERQLKRMYLGSNSWSVHNRGAVQSDHARLVLARDQVCSFAIFGNFEVNKIAIFGNFWKQNVAKNGKNVTQVPIIGTE